MFDAHCHLDDHRFDPDFGHVLERARDAGVRHLLLAGVSPSRWRTQSQLATTHHGLHVCYGLHPWTVAKRPADQLETMLLRLEQALEGGNLKRPVALGEIGLDRSGRVPASSMALQTRGFRAQLVLAHRFDLPVVLHVVQAHGRTLDILRQEGVPDRGGMVHAFSGSIEVARDYMALGLHLSFGGLVTRPRAKKARLAAASVPADRLLIETDCPDQTPQAVFGQRNEPAFLVHIVRELAALRGVDEVEIARVSERNAKSLFNL